MVSQQQQRIRGKYFGKKLKAKEVIELYKAGERNFQGAILRGQSFKGQDLSEADFREADIKGVNFAGANLIGANFANAQCGLKTRWLILLLILILSWTINGVGVRQLKAFVAETVAAGMLGALVGAILGLLVFVIEEVLGVSVALDVLVLIATITGVVSVIVIVKAGALAVGLVALAAAALIGATAVGIIGVATVGITGVGVAALISVDRLEVLGVVGVIGVIAVVEQSNHPLANVFTAKGATSFLGADLTEANFIGAKLKSTDFREANLTRVCWFRARMLNRVYPGNSYLKDAQLSQWLIGKGTDNNFDGKNLRGVNLQEANLTDASFMRTDLSEANLQNADLSRAKLLKTRLSGTDLTGACIEDWVINSQTILNNVICDYIYLKKGQQERRPSDPNRNFKPGEFAKLIQKSVETVDLIFKKGVDWKAVAFSLKSTQVLNENTPLAIQSIENKGDGVVLIKVNVPQNADKGKIEGDFWQGYEFANKTLKEQYKARLLDKDKYINQLFYSLNQAQEKLGEVPKLMAEQPKFQQNFNAPVYGNAQNVEGNQNIYASEQKQTLAQAAEEIQNLLKQLEKTNPSATEKEKIIYVNDETSPGLKRRTVSALKAGVETSIEEFLDNPYVNVGKAVVKGWMKLE